MTDDRRWRIRLASTAEEDYRNILRWAEERFGKAQARAYADTLTRAIQALSFGPNVAGTRPRNDVADGLMALHVAREGRKGRHLALYRVGSPSDPPVIDVLRLLHDSMDLPRHIPPLEQDDP